MKKRFTLLLGMAWVTCTLFAQITLKLADFENGTDNCFTGSSGNATGVNNGITKTVVSNPQSDVVNSSGKVLQVNYPALNLNTYGVLFCHGTGVVFGQHVTVPVGTETNQYRYLHFKILKTFSSLVEWQFRQSNGNGTGWYDATIAGSNDWQSITWDLMTDVSATSSISGAVTTASFYGYMMSLDKTAANTPFTVYLDDIYLSSSEVINDQTTIISNKAKEASDISVSKSLSGNAVAYVNGITGNLKLEVFNIQGQLVKEVYNGTASAGSYEIPSLVSGIYILKATTDSGIQTIKF